MLGRQTLRPLAWTHPPAGLDWVRGLLPGVGAAVDWLRSLDCPRGARVGVSGPGGPELATIIQALPLAGLCAVMLGPGSLSDDLALDLILDRIPSRWASGLPERSALRPLATGDPAVAVLTSGSQGQARPVRLAAGACAHAARAACKRLRVSEDDCWLQCLPWWHVGGLSILWRSAVSSCAVDCHERFEVEAVSLGLEGASLVSLVPTMLRRLIAWRNGRSWPVSLRCLLLGGAAAGQDVLDQSAALGCTPTQTWGLSECGGMVCTERVASGRAGQCGPPISGMAVSIGDGHLRVSGPALAAGYETAGRLTSVFAGAYVTGDSGQLAADGGLRVFGRLDDVIISGGENVVPTAVEDVLRQHPAIADAVVLGLPDAEWGQVVGAVVQSEAGLDNLALWLRERLLAWQRPRRLVVVKQLPTLANGKLDRQAVRQLLAE